MQDASAEPLPFEAFYEQYIGWVRTVVSRAWATHVFGNADKEDMMQATMLAAWQNFHKLRDNQHRLNWLRVVARYKMAQYAMRSYKRRTISLEREMRFSASDSEQFEGRWRARTVQTALSDPNAEEPFNEVVEAAPAFEVLAPREREVMTLMVGGCSQKDVAERLNISPGRLTQIVKRARARLEHELLVA